MRPEECPELLKLLSEAEHLQQCGSWRIDHCTGSALWSAQMHRLLQSDPSQSVSFERLLEAIHPDDRNVVAASVRQSWLSGRAFQLEHRLQLPDGRITLVLHRGDTRCGERGEALYTLGTLQNLNHQRNLQLEL